MALTRTTAQTALQIRKRRKHFLRKHRYADAFEAAGYERIEQQLRDCQETEVLACCSHCGKSWWILTRCRLRVCPLCSYTVAQQRADFLKAMTKHMHHPKLVTLTMPPWKDDPREGISYLRASFSKLRRSKVFKAVRGGAYQIEIKVHPTYYHIHMHILLDAPYIPHQLLFNEWKQILQVAAPQIDIRAAENDKAKAYVVKYAAKSADFDNNPETIIEWYKATKGTRLFGTFGLWYNAKIEELDDEQEHPQPTPVCPGCGEEGTTFFARDGPFIYGHDIWRSIEPYYLREQEWIRPIPVAADALYLDNDEFENKYPSPPEEKQQTQPQEVPA